MIISDNCGAPPPFSTRGRPGRPQKSHSSSAVDVSSSAKWISAHRCDWRLSTILRRQSGKFDENLGTNSDAWF